MSSDDEPITESGHQEEESSNHMSSRNVYLFVLYVKVNADKRERVDWKSTPPSFRLWGWRRGSRIACLNLEGKRIPSSQLPSSYLTQHLRVFATSLTSTPDTTNKTH